MSASPLTDAHVISSATPYVHAEDARGIEIQLREEIQRLKIGAARYEYLRKLNPREFTALTLFCVTADVRFDEEVDRRRNAK